MVCTMVWACDPSGKLTENSPPLVSQPQPTVDCVSGCTEGDPSPTAPGIYLTTAVTAVTCFNGSQTDADGDGVSDRCERDIAAAFAPELRYYNYDEVGREPHWAARKSGTNHVYVVYLLSYYRDAGNTSFGCGVPFHDPSCDGHNGDSENIRLDLYYNSSTQHWLLDNAAYSAHTSFNNFVRGTGAYPTALEYPAKLGGYPRAYVSQGKHANYGSQSSCNGGGFLSSDDCRLVNTSVRLYAGSNVNIGSRASHTLLQDCMTSSNPRINTMAAVDKSVIGPINGSEVRFRLPWKVRTRTHTVPSSRTQGFDVRRLLHGKRTHPMWWTALFIAALGVAALGVAPVSAQAASRLLGTGSALSPGPSFAALGWQASVITPNSEAAFLPHTRQALKSSTADHRWTGLALGAGIGAVVFGLIGHSTCEDGGACVGPTIGIGLLGAVGGGVIGGLLGTAIPKHAASE